VQDRLSTLASQLEAITLRIRAVGLARAADDLVKVSAELRRLQRLSGLPAVRADGDDRPGASRGRAT
jgi:hypothetical protein